ncbi:Gfo/Idh/MocA family oxidoreductase [Labrys neptuniae]|uniref:Gfo/Idh/MocA family protein n=1 Tax=Labrys neptuniae TaxID=376174 RepID=UPI00288EB1E9|nr:Gfo/Idh/MocA family oxidoreductase [Labrys neptuniae]MDT3378440.1 Gfo/Idh/MocA family oxidoreductase [Labrys neptuniae]
MTARQSRMEAYPRADRRLRLGFVGGGRGGQVGAWHAAGARLSNRWDIVAGALSADPATARASGRDWFLADDRIYDDYRTMAQHEAARPDGIDAVSICTPNHTHYDIARAFLEAGVNVICDKPLTTSLDEAKALMTLERDTGLVFGVTYAFAFHAMVRQARHMILAGRIGRVRQVHVEYFQEWSCLEEKPAGGELPWRQDPARVGRASAISDIGTHAFHLASYVTAEPIVELRADLHVCGPARGLEDTAFINIRLAGGAPGTLLVTQVAPGNYCALRLRVYGERGGIEWDQEKPEYLRVSSLGQPDEVIVRGKEGAMLPGVGKMSTLPSGHGEALSNAWANLYTEFAVAIEARAAKRSLPAGMLEFPTVQDGARGVGFIHAAVESHEKGGVWTPCWLT